MKKELRISWPEWMGMLFVIVAIIVVIDIYFETFYVGATARLVWNGIVFAILWLARTAEASAALLFRKRATRIFTGLVTAIGFVYVSHLILSNSQVRKAQSWREKIRVGFTMLRARWLRLPLWGKFVVVGCVILAQMLLWPSVAEWFVLFPIAFMVPVLVMIRQWITARIVDSFFGEWYWRHFGVAHRTTTTTFKKVPIARQIRGALWLMRLEYLTAWRMWKYAPCYQRIDGERRRISLFEPLRLWWRGELNGYVGRPLLGGRMERPQTTYTPPELWYNRPESEWAPFAQFGIVIAFVLIGMDYFTDAHVLRNTYHNVVAHWTR
jgi:hypothetical protein